MATTNTSTAAFPTPPPEPTSSEILTLFDAVEQAFPARTLGNDKWYILLLSALVSSGHPSVSALLYQQIVQRPEYASSEERQALLRRLRETLVKLVIIVGVCRPLEAVMQLHGVVREEDRDVSVTREGWQCDEKYRQRGEAWLGRLYKHNLQGAINETFAANRDFDWITKNITYGLFLSDHNVLNDVETELTVLAGIMMQNLPKESAWHIRGIRRIGVAKEDVESIYQCVELVARFYGVSLHKVPKVEHVEHEV